MKNPAIFLSTVFFLFSPVLFGQDELTNEDCKACHSDLSTQKSMHYPAEDACDNCHMANGNEHPAEGLQGFDLADEMPGLCFLCHEEYSKENVHGPAAMGECLMCHSPHGSEHSSLLLQANSQSFCGDCHDLSMLEKSVRHEAVDMAGCGSCHNAHESDFSYLLQAEKKELCVLCHESVGNELSLSGMHYPFEDDCGNCHETHSSANKSLLTQDMPSLCFDCHDTGNRMESSLFVHSVVNQEKSCAGCHSPHATGRGGLLLKSEMELCLDCHDRELKAGERTIAGIGLMFMPGNKTHGVFDSTACSACHESHASDHVSLLNSAFPSGLYATAQAENFELCFNCHDAALMEEEFTTKATGFRDGEVNLHFLHMKGEKARSCKLCHNVHTSPNSFLLAEMVPFGNWNMPMGFAESENGGSCNTGCHSRFSYSRER